MTTTGGELPDDFFYDLKSFERETPTSELPSSFAAPYHSFAFESAKRANLHYLDEGATLLYAAGDSPFAPAPAPMRTRIPTHARTPPAGAHRHARYHGVRAPPPNAVPRPQETTCTSSTWRR